MIKIKSNEELFNSIINLKCDIQYIAWVVQNDIELEEDSIEYHLDAIEKLKDKLDNIENKLRFYIFK